MAKTLRFDGASNEVLVENGEEIRPGETFTVDADERVEELITDPSINVREVAGEGEAKQPSRGELNARAREVGVPNPEKLPNRDAVSAAIEQVEAQPTGGEDHPNTEVTA